MRLLPRLGLALAAFALVVGSAGPARGAVLWTLTASPLTVSTGVQTTFTLRASLTLLGDIRCIEVGVPDNFTIQGASVVGSNAGDSWISEVFGNDVWIRTTSGGDRLRSLGHYVDFRITATAWSTGSLAWASHSHDQEDCSGGESLLSLPPVVLVTGPAVTPTPAPTVAPTVAPTGTPTVAPTPQPTPRPTPRATPTPRPPGPVATGAPTPRPFAAPTATPRPTPLAMPGGSSPSPEPSAVGPEASAADRPTEPAAFAPSSGDDGSTPAAPAEGRLVAEPPLDDGGPGPRESVPLGLGALGLLASIDVWIVPGLLLGVPGLLVVAFVLLQAIGALAWIPAIRRLRGDQEAEPASA
jgi:hypothetical protein